MCVGEDNGQLLSAEKSVRKYGCVVTRPGSLWTPSIHAYLRYLEQSGFRYAPKLVGDGVDADGNETIAFVDGEMVHPGPWTDDALIEMGRAVRQLHNLSAAFKPPVDAVWQPWFLRELGQGKLVFGHGDIAPWNIVTKGGMPIAFIDWEYAGPIDPIMELARVCWLFPQLHDEDVAEQVGLPALDVRAKQVRLIADAYGVSAVERHRLVDHIIEVVVCETAQEAIDQKLTPESVGPLWGLAWRSRAAAWILRNRNVLEQALR